MTIKQRKKEEGGTKHDGSTSKQGEKKTNKKGGEPNNKREATPASSGKLVLKIFGYSLVAAIIFLGMLNQERITRLYNVATLFHESKIVDNFRNTYYRGFPYRTAHHDPQRVAELLVDSKGQRALPSTFVNEGTKYSTAEFLQSTWTTGLVVLKIDSVTSARLLHESYYLGNTPRNKVISWSTGKSVVSALFGIAHAEGLIKSLHDPVTDYAPLLKGSGYEQVKIKDVLQMSSGIRFNEDYFDPFSDINVMGYVIGLGWSINEFVATLSSSREPGTFNHYVSMDTQVLGIILSEVLKPLNKTLTSYLEEKLWRHGGFEADVLWLLDNDHNQMELAFGTLNARTRDYARFGWLFHNRGKSPYDGRQLVPEQWVIDSTKPDAPHLQPGHHHLHDYPFGYGYQWWLPGSEEDPSKLEDDYLAIGVYNQFIYISPRHNIIIARNSANAHYEHGPRESESKAVSLFRTIAKAFADE